MRCPICKRQVPEPPADAPRGHYPFCSDRCKLIDLGRWLDGRYQIPVAQDDESHDGEGIEGDDFNPQAPRRRPRT
jgi:endogenous inhibitor of DNA gyrase (YacG/DUF329 family)